MKRLRCLLLPAVAASGFLLLAAQPVFAAEEGGGASPLTPVFQWVNFAMVAGAIGWLLVKKAPPFFAARGAQIASAIDNAGEAKARAEAQRSEALQRLANLGPEIAQLQADARRDAAAEVQRIQAAAKEESAKVHAAARMEVEAAARGARIELRRLATSLSIERAEEVLRTEITPVAEEGMFTAFLGKIVHSGEQDRFGGQAGRPN